MWTVILKPIPLCSLKVQNKGKQLPIKTSELSRQRRKTGQNNSSNNKSKGLISQVHVIVEPCRKTERGERWLGALEHWSIGSKTAMDIFVQMAPDATPHFYALGSADWTMVGRNMIGFAPSFMGNLKGSQYERHGLGFDWSWLRTPPWWWSISNSTPANALTVSEQPTKMCCITQKVASCLTYLHHRNHFSDDCPNDVTSMWVCNVDVMFPSPILSSLISVIWTNLVFV